ncbi:PEP-CTERM sorting domain-containing protein [Colwelliaceae bacterium MEBiC 14330]
MLLKNSLKLICIYICITPLIVEASTFNIEIDADLDNSTVHWISLNGNEGPAEVLSFTGRHEDNDNITHLYCAELTQGLATGINEFTQVPLSSLHNKYHKAAWLMDTFSPYVDTPQSGAVQLAIWEAIHESSGSFDLYSGTFMLINSWTLDFATEIADITSTFLSMYDPDKDLSNYVVYQSATLQDTVGNELEIPEPSTLFLFMFIGGFLWMKNLSTNQKKLYNQSLHIS